MANCDMTVFHWVSQYQLMPVWQEYPPPFTAYESYYLEKDRQKFYHGCSDNSQSYYDSHQHRMPSTACSSQLPPYIVQEGSMVSEVKSQGEGVFSSPYLSNPAYNSPPNFVGQNQMTHWSETSSSVSESPQPKIRLAVSRENYYNNMGPDLSLESGSSDFSQEENKEEESEDVENSEDENEVFGSKRKNSFDLSAMNEVSQQPRKRQRTTPEQLEVLEKVYEHEKLPNSDLRKELAVKLKMTPRRVQVWFQNKRAKEKRMYPK